MHSLAATAGSQSSFIVCDKRSDVNRVVIPAERLIQWQCRADLICEFVASSLGLRPSTRKTDIAGRWEIGICFGEKRSQMLCLDTNGKLSLIAGNNMIPLAELIQFRDTKYSLDSEMICRLVDAATTADERYTPSVVRRQARKLNTQAIYDSWKRAYRQLLKRRPGMSDIWYSLQIAKDNDIANGRDSETIRKHMKK